jgi:DNA-3-methyladenine glycosylase I
MQALIIFIDQMNSKKQEITMSVLGNDGKKRCFGGQPGKELYAAYHDHEWGIPSHDDQHLFEMLILEGAQAGLTWETILKRRNNYRILFHNFDPTLVAPMKDKDLEAILQNPMTIRNRLKIYVFLKIQEKFGSFDLYLWQFVNGQPIKNHWQNFTDIPVSTPESLALAKDLKRFGMSFVGPTIMYAYMQAVGLVDDHLSDCWCYR